MALGVFTFVLMLSTAVVVFRAAPHRAQNRALSLLMLLAALFSIGEVHRLVSDANLATAFRNTAYSAYVASPFAYLLFLSTVASPLVRPLRPRVVQGALLAMILVVLLTWPLVRPAFFSTGGAGPAYDSFNLAVAGVALCGLVVALSAYHRAPRGGTLHAQAKAYVCAFGVRDIILVGILIGYQTYIWGHWGVWLYPAVFLSDILFGVFITYGALKTQLFDIDLKLKWTLKRSTLIAGLAAVFFLVKEGIEAVLPAEGVVPSIAGAALVGLVALPAWRFANRLVDRAMPSVQDTLEYRQERKEAIYRAALVGALDDGSITEKERGILAALAMELGLDPVVRQRLERSIVAAAPGAAEP